MPSPSSSTPAARNFPNSTPIRAGSGAQRLFDALYATASEKLADTRGERKAIILFSDGGDNSSSHDLIEAIEAAQAADCLIYTVRYTEGSKGKLKARDVFGVTEMNRLAKETGGAAFDASQGDVAKSLRLVADELRSLYDLGYTTTNATADGRYRKVEIRVKRPGLTVRAKPGYYARETGSAGQHSPAPISSIATRVESNTAPSFFSLPSALFPLRLGRRSLCKLVLF